MREWRGHRVTVWQRATRVWAFVKRLRPAIDFMTLEYKCKASLYTNRRTVFIKIKYERYFSEIVFLVGVGGLSVLGGFSYAISASRKQDDKIFQNKVIKRVTCSTFVCIWIRVFVCSESVGGSAASDGRFATGVASAQVGVFLRSRRVFHSLRRHLESFRS